MVVLQVALQISVTDLTKSVYHDWVYWVILIISIIIILKLLVDVFVSIVKQSDINESLALISGKGGSGKTTIGLSIASLLSQCEIEKVNIAMQNTYIIRIVILHGSFSTVCSSSVFKQYFMRGYNLGTPASKPHKQAKNRIKMMRF